MGIATTTIACLPLAFLLWSNAYTEWFGILVVILPCTFVSFLLIDRQIDPPRAHRESQIDTPPYRNRNIEYHNPFGRRDSRISPVRITIRFTEQPIPGTQPALEAQEKTPEDTDAANPEESCVVCLVHKKNHVAMPCRHLCLCGTCKTTGKVTSCPICREENITFMLVY